VNLQAIKRIERQYNPDHDVNTDPSAPAVTWAEYSLALTVSRLAGEVEKLQERIEQRGSPMSEITLFSRVASPSFSVETYNGTTEIHIYSHYDKENIILADADALEELHELIGRILSQEQETAVNGKGGNDANH
jgi:hypothetical protein